MLAQHCTASPAAQMAQSHKRVSHGLVPAESGSECRYFVGCFFFTLITGIGSGQAVYVEAKCLNSPTGFVLTVKMFFLYIFLEIN